MSFFRYPGGKKKLLAPIRQILNRWSVYGTEYREPFVGGGAIGVDVLLRDPYVGKVWFNDFDVALAALWQAIAQDRVALKALVTAFVPTVTEFFRLKAALLAGTLTNPVELGFSKLAIHQMSYSGLGVKAAGPIGGKNQTSAYAIDCRWNPKYINAKIDAIGRGMDNHQFQVTSLDYALVILQPSQQPVILYVDPPYWTKGNELYQHGFTVADHTALAQCLHESPHKWVLSYDDTPEIRALYAGWTDVMELDVAYTIAGARQKGELLLWRS